MAAFGLVSRTALLAMALLGCGSRSGIEGPFGDGDGDGYRWEAGVSGGRASAPRSCVEDWRILYESEAFISTPLAMADGELIFGVAATESGPAEIRALDVAAPSRIRRVVQSGLGDGLWIEGDELLFWARDRVVRVPLQGGAEEVLLDARSAEASGEVDGVLVESDVIYWARVDDASAQLELWQQPRGGGPPGLVGSVDRGAIHAQALAATSEGVIVAGSPRAVAFSLSGAAPRLLDEVSDGALAGADGRGAYYVREANRTRRGGRAIEFEIRRAPVDGSPSTRFWRGRAGEHLMRLWPAESGWFAIGTNYMFDGRPHAVIAHIDESGDAVWIACDRSQSRLSSRPVFWQQAFYAVVSAGQVWRIVEIRLPE